MRAKAPGLGTALPRYKHETAAQTAAASGARGSRGCDILWQGTTSDPAMQAGRIRDLKAQYKAQYAELQMVKSEMDWTQTLVEQCTRELVDDFDAWWAVLMGTLVNCCAARLCSLLQLRPSCGVCCEVICTKH